MFNIQENPDANSRDQESDDAKQEVRNEIQEFQNARYIGASEAASRILGYELQFRYPSVVRLDVHLPGEQAVFFKEFWTESQKRGALENSQKTKLNQWFAKNEEELRNPLSEAELGVNHDGQVLPRACELKYPEFPKFYSWNSNKSWKRRVNLSDVVSRVYSANPREGERYVIFF